MSATNWGTTILAAKAANVRWKESAKRMFVRLLIGSNSEPTLATKAHKTTYGAIAICSLFTRASMMGVRMTAVVSRDRSAVTIAPIICAFR
jgi:hypothetical protein